jgi:hypothetical protein
VPHHVESDTQVRGFGFVADAEGRRLVFPHAESREISGRSGTVAYGSADAVFENVAGRLDMLRWTADSASIGGTWLRDDAQRIDMSIGRVELPRGVLLTRAATGFEAVAPYAVMSDLKVIVQFPEPKPAPPTRAATVPPAPRELRQDKLRFLDSLAGRVGFTGKVVLDLPVIGKRTLDQQENIQITEGSLDFRALEDNLNWLEGQFLDIAHDDDRLAVRFKVPIFGTSRELIAWHLEPEAATLATFGRVPVRALTDFQLGSGIKKTGDHNDKKRTFQALSVENIDVALSLLAPRSLEIGAGLIMFGGEDSPGMVDLKLTGALSDRGPGKLRGTLGSLDTTVKDLRFGPLQLTADRIHVDSIDELELTFDKFRPTRAALTVHRVTASNLALTILRQAASPARPS